MIDHWKPPIVNPDDLATEPFVDKAARLLTNLRDFAASQHGVTAFEIDGVTIMLVKYDPNRHPPEGDYSTSFDIGDTQ